MRLSGKRALVTGSSRGIGAEVAALFAKEGAKVVVSHRLSSPHKEEVAERILKEGGEALTIHCDVSSPGSVSEMFSEVKRRLGGLDVLVNCAGLSDRSLWTRQIGETTLDMLKSVFEVDAFGTFLSIQGALPLMGRGASIVNIASTPALAGDADGLAYASAKGAVVSMTRMMAKSLAPNVRVNCMALGSIRTTWVDWLDAAQRDSYLSAIPMRRFGEPTDVANLALFLASDESSFITGQVVVVDGGEVLR